MKGQNGEYGSKDVDLYMCVDNNKTIENGNKVKEQGGCVKQQRTINKAV